MRSLLVVLTAIGVIVGVIAVAAGRITGGLDDPESTVPARALPDGPLSGSDVGALRFVPALRGYRMDQVDAAMDRLATELDRLRAAAGVAGGPEVRAAELPPHPDAAEPF